MITYLYFIPALAAQVCVLGGPLTANHDELASAIQLAEQVRGCPSGPIVKKVNAPAALERPQLFVDGEARYCIRIYPYTGTEPAGDSAYSGPAKQDGWYGEPQLRLVTADLGYGIIGSA